MARNKGQKPTSERIRELFNYDAETGVVTRRIPGRTWSVQRRYGVVGAGSISTHGYVMISIDGHNYNVGCIAWSFTHGEWPRGTIRYRNGNKTDNRLANLLIINDDKDQVKNRPLTQARLKELLHYEPKTGWFTWRVASPLANVGERAGGHHGFGYRTIGIDYNKYLEHHLAFLYMNGEWSEFEIDHKNKKRDDNRWDNLRPVTRTENNHNRARTRTGSIGYTGVHKCGERFRAILSHGRQEHHLGVFATVAEARVARLLGEIEHIGHTTSFDDEKDGSIPLGDGRFIGVTLSTSEVRGTRCESLGVTNQYGVPFWVKGVKTVTMIIEAWSPNEADRSGFQVVAENDKPRSGTVTEINGPLGFGA